MPPFRLLFLLLASASAAFADVALPAIFGDHMVLQRDGAAPVWGTADPGEQVTVTAGAATGSATAGADGKWIVRLSGLPASADPIEVTVQGKNRVVLRDVLVGDVWLCSGQSNMNFGVKMDASAAAEIPKANRPQLRLYCVPGRVSPLPQSDFVRRPPSTAAQWLVCTPETVVQNGWGGFSAVGYFFGRDLQEAIRQPVGLIECVFSGTPAEAWTSLEALQAVPALKEYADAGADYRRNYDARLQAYNATLEKWKGEFAQWKAAHADEWSAYQAQAAEWRKNPAGPAPKNPLPGPEGSPDRLSRTSTVLFNGMVAPLVPYGIKGAVWYQGEGNATTPQRALDYVTLLPTMIGDWRTRWGQGDFPFLIVQLANWSIPERNPAHEAWPYLREAQAKALSLPNTGLAAAIDVGEPANLHPPDKADVGARLALVARKVAYREEIVATGPVLRGAAAEDGKIRVAFDSVGQGLAIGVPPPRFHPGEPRSPAAALRGFALAGPDGKYVDADAALDGDTVVVSSPRVPRPATVRYDWADVGGGNLYNKEGLPAFPFRTDALPPASPAEAGAKRPGPSDAAPGAE